MKGEGNQQDYGMRIYDGRVGRFLSVDPISQSYPWYTPYQFAGNTPIQAIDLDGMEPVYTRLIPGSQEAALNNVSEDMTAAYFFLNWRAAMKNFASNAGAQVTQSNPAMPGSYSAPIVRKKLTVMVDPAGEPYLYQSVVVESRLAALGNLVLDGGSSYPNVQKGGLSTGVIANAPGKSTVIKEIGDGLRSIASTYQNAKHIAARKLSWDNVVKSTVSGAAKFRRDIDVDAITLEAWNKGKEVAGTEGNRNWKVYEFGDDIGASKGKESRWLRVEMTEAGNEKLLHSHPITESEYKKLSKRE